MSQTLACPQDHDAVDAAHGRCEACGAALFFWNDGLGQPWRVEASPEEIRLVALGNARLTGEGDAHIGRATWPKAVSFSPSGSRLVIHFDTGTREIGFSVPQEDAARLVGAMGVEQAKVVEPPRHADEPLKSLGPERRRSDSPAWPKMTAASIAALISACLAFLPFIGLVFVLVALTCAIVALRRARPNASYAHVRTMARTSIVIAIAGGAIGLLATWVMAQDLQALTEHGLWSRIGLVVSGMDLEWSWGARIGVFVAIIIGLSVHEAAHAITAWWSGDGLARSMGRVTLNPLQHIDPFGTILLPLMLTAAGAPVFGYARPVPTQLGGVPRFWRAQALVAAAGPMSNLLQACLCLAALMLLGLVLRLAAPEADVIQFSSLSPAVTIEGLAGGKVLAALALLLKLGYQINVMVAFFNLIPVPPLDGSWIAQYLAPGFIGRLFATIRPYGFVIFLGLFLTGALQVLLTPGYYVLAGGHILLALTTGM